MPKILGWIHRVFQTKAQKTAQYSLMADKQKEIRNEIARLRNKIENSASESEKESDINLLRNAQRRLSLHNENMNALSESIGIHDAIESAQQRINIVGATASPEKIEDIVTKTEVSAERQKEQNEGLSRLVGVQTRPQSYAAQDFETSQWNSNSNSQQKSQRPASRVAEED